MTMSLVVSDLCCVLLGVYVGFAIWGLVNPRIPPLHPVMFITPLLSVAAFLFFGLYPGLGLTVVMQMRRLCHGLTLVFLLFTAAMFMTKDRLADSRGGFVIAWALSIAMAPLGRWCVSRLLTSHARWGVPVVVIGAGEAARAVVGSLHDNRILGYRPVACIAEFGTEHGCDCAGLPIAGYLSDIEAVAGEHGASHAIVAMPAMEPGDLMIHMRTWSKIFPRILIVPNLAGIPSLWTEPRDLGGVLALEIKHNLLDVRNRFLKRLTDIVLSILAVPFVLPALAGICIVMRATVGGDLFYSHTREGKGGRLIKVYKLRTMHENADALLQQHLANSPEAAIEWKCHCKLKKDPRVLPGIGNFIRRTSIDELPQLWNVLKGEMSLVGPRPFPDYHNSLFDNDFRALRLHVTPGLTGLWQVGARSDGDLKVQESLDSYYIRNWSLWLDFYILLRTVRAVMFPSGSY